VARTRTARVSVGAFVGAAALGLLATGAGGRPHDGHAQPTLARQAGQLVVLRFAGTSAPAYVLEALRDGRAAGAILFRDNLSGPAQARALAAQLRRSAQPPPLICVDQEGGRVRILPWVGPERSPRQQRLAGTERSDAARAARALRATGINVVLAPVADVPSVPRAALAPRAFSSDFAAAAESVAESVRGWRSGGVASTVKHFPGLGAATVNTDQASVTITRGAARLRRADLAPFRSAIAAGVPLVMVGHATYPAIDPHRIASQSTEVVDGLLRDELGFRGVVITDSTEAAAVRAVASPAQAALRNVRAGVDIVLTTGRGSYGKVYRALLAEARRDPAFRARARESAARVLALREALARKG
jgi:beta-N-acetylhexosaminidase